MKEIIRAYLLTFVIDEKVHCIGIDVLEFFLQAQTLPAFNPNEQPAAPDYSLSQNWLALPFREDGADVIPKGEKWISDSLKSVDVFYIYPTLYLKGNTWCADVKDEKLNYRLNKYPVKFQAAVFNHVGRIYAPLYRQGMLKCFEDTTGNGAMALEFAYQDVKRAFEYFLENFNNGRPIMIVSHSQGTRHARQLLKDFFDTPEMNDKLLCAYTVGFGMYKEDYSIIKPCADENQTNCFVTWSSFKEKYNADHDTLLFGNVCVNPISWRMDSSSAENNCGVLLNINYSKPYCTQARIHSNYLWIKTRVPFAQMWKVMHVLDFNLFWHEIRKNASGRVAEYWKARKM